MSDTVIFRMQGDAQLVSYLAGLPANIRAAVLQKMQSQSTEFSQYVKNEKLSGQVLNTKSGRLKASIYSRVYSSASKMTISSGSRGGIPYAPIQEYGGRTRPHMITSSKGTALSFVWAGRHVMSRSVMHPGSVMPERSYLRSALREKSDLFQTEVTATIMKVARGNS